jgi:hypothetical protein
VTRTTTLEGGKMTEESGGNKSAWGVWRNGDLLIAKNGAKFPNICIKCGQPTQNRKKQAITYFPHKGSILTRLFFGGMIGDFYRRSQAIQFEFSVPVCPSCKGWGKLLVAIDADSYSGSFEGASEGFLMHLEKAPPKGSQGILGLS